MDTLQIHHLEEMTRLEHPDFSAYLPFKWQQVPAEGIQLINQDLPEQMFIRVIPAPMTLQRPMMLVLRDELLKTQRQAMATLVAEVEDASAELVESDESVEARLLGISDQQQLSVAFLVRVSQDKSLTVSFYRYTSWEAGTPFDEYTATIFDHFRIK